MKDTGGEGHPV